MKEKFILLVEDNPDDAELTLRALGTEGCIGRMEVVKDGVEALEYLLGGGLDANTASAVPPDLILLDLKLPRLGGLEVLQRIRESGRTRNIPVVVLTSSTERNDLCQAYRRGANSYIRKTVDYIKFVEAAREIVRYWLVLNEPPPADCER